MIQIEKVLDSIDEKPKQTFTRSEVKQLFSEAVNYKSFYSLPKIKYGDVFVSKIRGGKIAPYVCLKTKGDLVGAVTLTSFGEEVMSVKSQCRFYPESYFGNLLAIFNQEAIRDKAFAPYSNKKHLREVKKNLLEFWK